MSTVTLQPFLVTEEVVQPTVQLNIQDALLGVVAAMINAGAAIVNAVANTLTQFMDFYTSTIGAVGSANMIWGVLCIADERNPFRPICELVQAIIRAGTRGLREIGG